MKSSKSVNLVLLGTLTATLIGCDDDVQVKQNQYASEVECQRDWNEGCYHGGGSSGYFGPRYFYDHNTNQAHMIMPDGSTRPSTGNYLSRGTPSTAKAVVSSGVIRGGFGGGARAVSAGG